MNQVQAEFLDSELLKDAESTAQLPSLSEVAPLKTARLLSIAPPPTSPLPGTTALPTGTPGPVIPAAAAVPSVGEGTTRYRPETFERAAWLKALLKSTFPPPRPNESHDALLMRRIVGATCIGVAVVLGIVALALGLGSAPRDPALAPQVAAAYVVVRGLFALGAGAFGFGLIRLAERTLRA